MKKFLHIIIIVLFGCSKSDQARLIDQLNHYGTTIQGKELFQADFDYGILNISEYNIPDEIREISNFHDYNLQDIREGILLIKNKLIIKLIDPKELDPEKIQYLNWLNSNSFKKDYRIYFDMPFIYFTPKSLFVFENSGNEFYTLKEVKNIVQSKQLK